MKGDANHSLYKIFTSPTEGGKENVMTDLRDLVSAVGACANALTNLDSLISAINELVREQRKTNELLEKLTPKEEFDPDKRISFNDLEG